jgi:uncharacterized protein YceK
MRTLVLAVAVSVSGCAPQLVKEGITQEQAAADTQECKYQAAAATAPMLSALDRGLRQNELVGECLRAKGYR